MRYLKYFESNLHTDIEDMFYELTDLGFDFKQESNKINLTKIGKFILSDVMREIQVVTSRLKDRIINIEINSSINRFILNIELKTELFLNVKVGDNENRFNIVDIKSDETKFSLKYDIKGLDSNNKVIHFKITIYLDGYNPSKELDIEYTYNNRKRGVSVNSKELLDVLTQYDDKLKIIDFIKKDLKK